MVTNAAKNMRGPRARATLAGIDDDRLFERSDLRLSKSQVGYGDVDGTVEVLFAERLSRVGIDDAERRALRVDGPSIR